MKKFKTYIEEQENMRLFLSKYEEQLTYEAAIYKRKGRVPKNERFSKFAKIRKLRVCKAERILSKNSSSASRISYNFGWHSTENLSNNDKGL